MKKFFRKLKRDCKGAVTVFVTLLLIPSILVSGSGVDIARIYAAKSIVQDANQLGANAALASYDALLQDLYGLYGIMANDEEFAALADEYIKLTIFGEDWIDREMGSFQLFYGSEVDLGDIQPESGRNLANEAVLRRQIEEYAKFRAPVIIVEEVMSALDSFKKVQKDSEVIKLKMDIDERVEEIDELYKQIYDGIPVVNGASTVESDTISEINTSISELEQVIDDLYETRGQYTDAVNSDDEETADDYEKKYNALMDNFRALVNGGSFGKVWVSGGYDDEGEWQDGGWSYEEECVGLNKRIENAKEGLEDYKEKLSALKTLCDKAQKKKAELETKLNDLKAKLDRGECSEQLSEGLTERSEETGRSTIEEYEALLAYDVRAMGEAVYDHNVAQINSFIELIESVYYGTASGSIFYNRDRLSSLRATDFPINLILENMGRDPSDRLDDALALIDSVTPKKYSMPENKYEPFESTVFDRTKNSAFYEELCKLYGGTADKSDSKKKSIKKTLNGMLGDIQDQYKGFLEFDPAGAHVYENGGSTVVETSTDFGTSGNWEDNPDQIKNSLDDSLVKRIGNLGNDVTNKVLLLCYDTEMFSCYTTNDGETDDRPLEENMNGILLSTDVNYFFQSELEFLYKGSNNAIDNLKAVTGMIFLVRFVFNYVASFMIPTVKNTVNAVKASLAWAGPFATLAGELVRLVMALGESVIDVSRLKNDAKVMLFKRTSDDWRFSLDGVLNMIKSGTEAELSDGMFSTGENNDDDSTGLRYKDYMRIFLLLVDGDTLALRTRQLIEMNVTNKKNGINANEEAMKAAEKVDLSQAVTDFTITTSVDLKMLFLSMPFAQKGVNGTVPPGKLALSVTDYRGY